MLDYMLPCSVIVLKFIFRLAIGQPVTKVDLFRAFLNFPIDLAFLALSFAAVMLSVVQTSAPFRFNPKDAYAIFLIYVAMTAIVTLAARKSDAEFNLDRKGATIGWMLPGYMISIYLLYVLFAGAPK